MVIQKNLITTIRPDYVRLYTANALTDRLSCITFKAQLKITKAKLDDIYPQGYKVIEDQRTSTCVIISAQNAVDDYLEIYEFMLINCSYNVLSTYGSVIICKKEQLEDDVFDGGQGEK